MTETSQLTYVPHDVQVDQSIATFKPEHVLPDKTFEPVLTTHIDALSSRGAEQPPPALKVEHERGSGSEQVILAALERQFSPVDFWARAALRHGEKLKTKHYLIITIEEVLKVANQNGWGLGQSNNFAYLFNGSHWQSVDAGELRAFLRKVAQKLGVDKFDAAYHLFVDQLYKQFMDLGHIPVIVDRQEKVLINLRNGTFEITPEGKRLRPPNQSDFLTYQLPFPYDSQARAPSFERYLNTVLPDQECRQLLAEFIGYVFVNSKWLKLEKALILHGSGANGKSVFFEVILALLGTQNVSNYSLASLTDGKGYHLAMLQNKLVNYASELSGKLDANVFKQLASGEPVEARLPYQAPFILTNYAKLIFNCNELPKGAENTPAFFRRFAIVPFNVTIPEADQDKQLARKIIDTELSGVFNWVLEGLDRLLVQRRLTESRAVQDQVLAYQLQSDSVKLFMDEHGYTKSATTYQTVTDLYAQYKGFCVDDGHRPVSKSNLIKRLRNDGYLTERKNIGWVAYLTTTTK